MFYVYLNYIQNRLIVSSDQLPIVKADRVSMLTPEEKAKFPNLLLIETNNRKNANLFCVGFINGSCWTSVSKNEILNTIGEFNDV